MDIQKLALLLAASAAALLGQSNWRGIQPGTATRAQLERVAGPPVQALTDALIEYKGEQADQRAFVQYRGGVVERIEIILTAPMELSAARRALGLASPQGSKQNSRGKTEEYYASKMMVLTVGGGGVERYAYYSRELFQSSSPNASAVTTSDATSAPAAPVIGGSRLPPPVANPPVAAGTAPATPVVNSVPVRPVATSITIPAATKVKIFLGEKLTTAKNKVGDKFTGTLAEPIVIEDEAAGIKGEVVADKGAKVEGRIVGLSKSGRVKGVGEMNLELTGLQVYGAEMVAVSTGSFIQTGEGTLGSDAKKAGAATGIGAAIGAIAGGGKGAAIGAGAGAAAGVGAILITRGKPAELNVEALLELTLSLPVTVRRRLGQ